MKCNNTAGFLTELCLYLIRHSAVSMPHHPTELAQKDNINWNKRQDKEQRRKAEEVISRWRSCPGRKAIFHSFSQGLPFLFFTQLFVSAPAAAFPRCVSKCGRGSVFVCAPRVFTRAVVAVLSSPPRVLGNGPCYFILGQCQLMSGSKDQPGQLAPSRSPGRRPQWERGRERAASGRRAFPALYQPPHEELW